MKPTVDQLPHEKASPGNWIGVILAYLLMPLVLLTSGWDLGWWQG